MDIAGPTSHSFISQRMRLRYVDWGNPEAPPLILQHGGRDHCRSWDWAAQQLREQWHVICPDLRGHGDSDWSADGDYAMSSFVYDFAQLIETLGYDQVTVVAHSMGGVVASRFTGLYPERVRKLVNIEGLGFAYDARGNPAGQSYAERFRKYIESRRRFSGFVAKRYPSLEAAYARMKEANPYLTDAQARHLTHHAANRNEDGTWSWKYDPALNVFNPFDPTYDEIRGLWQAITCPVLLLWGRDSFFSTPEDDGRLDNFQKPTLKVYEKAGHWLHHDQFDRFMTDVRAFIDD